MNVVFSRKGFDGRAGGFPSPIAPDGTLVSLPIPGLSRLRYDDVMTPLGPMGELLRGLSGGRRTGREPVHLDPDLDPGARPRLDGWRASLGQVGAAQTHLSRQHVGPGDVFVFFGSFRRAVCTDEGWRWVRGDRPQHTVFGYLSVGEVLDLGEQPDAETVVAERPWLLGHPHLRGRWPANNTLYVAGDRLVLDGRTTDLPGAAAFPVWSDALSLTAPGQSASRWLVPDWLDPTRGGTGLTYHGDPERWSVTPSGATRLQTVGQGQEFVADARGRHDAAAWIEALVRDGLNGRQV